MLVNLILHMADISNVAKPFAISKFPITNREWKECVAAKACDYMPVGNDDAPVANVSWNDAHQFG